MITISEVIGTVVALLFLFGMAVLGLIVYRKEQERILDESNARIDMYNAITDLCESWIESDAT